MMAKWKLVSGLSLGLIVAPAFGASPAVPGTVNYVEGTVTLDNQTINGRSVGSAQLNPGDVLATQAGKAEVLLTPGVFLRVDNNSAVKMVSPDLIHTQIELVSGRAAVEVDELFKQNDLEVVDDAVTTQLVKPGFYEFSAVEPEVQVFEGKAAVEVNPGKYKVVKDHHEFALTATAGDQSLAKEKPADFDVKKAQDDLYNWNSLRSEYVAEANNQIAPQYAGAAGFAPGWYWDPYAWNYTFIGVDPFWSPFGWGFYPYGWGGGWYGGYGGWYGGHRWGYAHPIGGTGRVGGVHSNPAPTAGGIHGGGFAGGGFHGGGGLSGGGFHGGGGGHR